MSKTIVKQSIEGGLVYCTNGPMGVRSPISKTSTKQGRDCFNVSKTIEKKGIKGSLEYCAKGAIKVISPMSKTRLKQDIEGKWGESPQYV